MERVSSGVPDIDVLLGGLNQGDNVSWVSNDAKLLAFAALGDQARRLRVAPAWMEVLRLGGAGTATNMTNPQQPELARSRRGATSDDSVKGHLTGQRTSKAGEGPQGPIPEDNQPNHHPEVEQDKPA